MAASFGTVLCSFKAELPSRNTRKGRNRDKPEKEGGSCSVVTPLALPSDRASVLVQEKEDGWSLKKCLCFGIRNGRLVVEVDTWEREEEAMDY